MDAEKCAALTYALEDLGDIDNKASKIILLHFLEHDNSIVKEGALLGLSKLSPDEEIINSLEDALDNEYSQAIIELIREVLEDIKGGS